MFKLKSLNSTISTGDIGAPDEQNHKVFPLLIHHRLNLHKAKGTPANMCEVTPRRDRITTRGLLLLKPMCENVKKKKRGGGSRGGRGIRMTNFYLTWECNWCRSSGRSRCGASFTNDNRSQMRVGISVVFILTTFISLNLYLKKSRIKSLFKTKCHGEHGTRRWPTSPVSVAVRWTV